MEDIDAVEIFHSGRWNNTNDWRSEKPFSVRHGWIDRPGKPQEPAGAAIKPLKNERWHLENLEAAEELRLIHCAQAGDRTASETLFRHHYKQILKIAGQFKQRLGADDATAIACEGFFYALQNYKQMPGSARLSTYAARCISGRLLDAQKPRAVFGLSGKVPKGERIKFHELEGAFEYGPTRGRLRDVENTISTESWSVWHSNRFASERSYPRGIEQVILRKSFGKSDFAWAGDSQLERIALAQDEAWTRRIKEIGRRADALELVARRRVIGKTEFISHEPNWKAAVNEQYKKSKRRESVRNDKPAVAARNGAPYRAGRIRAWHAQGTIHQVGM